MQMNVELKECNTKITNSNYFTSYTDSIKYNGNFYSNMNFFF